MFELDYFLNLTFLMDNTMLCSHILILRYMQHTDYISLRILLNSKPNSNLKYSYLLKIIFFINKIYIRYYLCHLLQNIVCFSVLRLVGLNSVIVSSNIPIASFYVFSIPPKSTIENKVA